MTENSSEASKGKPLIRVLAADSTRVSGQLLSNVLARNKRFHVLAPQLTSHAILAATANEKPDVVLLSTVLENDPALGFHVARQLRSEHPATRIVMLLDRSERAATVEAFRAGASGMFCRSESLKLLPRCISCVHAGQVWANSHELKYLLDALSEPFPARRVAKTIDLSILSRREQDVVSGVADGLSNREIANRLKLTEHTVKNYLFRIFDKLGVSSRVEVVLYAFGLAGAVPQVPVKKPSNGQVRPSRNGNKGRKSPKSALREGNEASPDLRRILPL